MAEPLSIATAIGKLLGTGYGLYKAASKHGTDLDLDLNSYKSLVELGGQFQSWLPKGASPQLQAQALAILTAAFGRAFREHFGPRKAFDDPKRLEAHFAAAIDWARPTERPSPNTPPDSLPELLADPAKSRYFAALWQSFTMPNLPAKIGDKFEFDEPLIEKPTGEDRLLFEQIFRRSVMGLLAAPAGRDLSISLLNAKPEAERAEWAERLIVADMAGWGKRHVFGNVHGHDTLPQMPLATMYVEPNAVLRGEYYSGNQSPIRQAVWAALKKNPLVVVTADFGHGKSLTARTLAYEAAILFLATGDKPRAELVRPVFVKCQSAVNSTSFELSRATQRAQWQDLKELGITALRDTDPALLPPPDSQSTLYIIDGLDEVAFLERGVCDFFEHLRGQLTSNHRAVVFSRPHTIPYGKLKEWEIPVFELRSFDIDGTSLGQVGEWLTRWNACSGREPIEPTALQQSGLLELAQTPILLFMIAYTWGDLDTLYVDWKTAETTSEATGPREPRWDQQHRLYESFFRAMAWGKYEHDRDKHPLISKAAIKLRDALETSGLLPASSDAEAPSSKQHAERDALTEAMLWLMSRIAWEMRCLEQEPKPKTLQKWRINQLLEKELELDDSKTVEVVSDGLLLAMQADLSEGSRPVLFGHKSFREFLVGRCWAGLLRVVSDPKILDSQKAKVVSVLRSGRLRDGDDRSFDFLRAQLRQWDPAIRQRLSIWAEHEFDDERLEGPQATLRSDLRRDFRTTTLALATALASRKGFQLKDETSLRSLLASYWIAGMDTSLWAPRLVAPHTQLSGSNFVRANLEGANLEGADLSGANLEGADLSGANLFKANLSGANLSGANLSESDLTGAHLSGANLFKANLFRANLEMAHLEGVNLEEANLEAVRLFMAILERANLKGASLKGAFRYGANLEGANLEGANLNWLRLDALRFDITSASGVVLNVSAAALGELSSKDLLADARDEMDLDAEGPLL